jgi:hypothetical protein
MSRLIYNRVVRPSVSAAVAALRPRWLSTPAAAVNASPATAAAVSAAPSSPQKLEENPELSGFSDRGEAVGFTGGAPEEFVRRTCRIYKPSRSATQQGDEELWSVKILTISYYFHFIMHTYR